MKPVLSRAIPAAALSIPLLLAGAAAATAGSAPMAAGGPVITDGGHDPAPTPSAEPSTGTGTDGATGHDADMDMSSHDDGMDMSGHDDADMAGHDEGGSDPGTTSEGDHTGTGDHSGTSDHGSTEGPRPRAAVLSSFAGVNAAVLVGAAFLRRRDRAAHGRRPGAKPERGAPATTTSPGDPSPADPASRS